MIQLNEEDDDSSIDRARRAANLPESQDDKITDSSLDECIDHPRDHITVWITLALGTNHSVLLIQPLLPYTPSCSLSFPYRPYHHQLYVMPQMQ